MNTNLLNVTTPVAIVYTDSGSVYALTFGAVIRFNGFDIKAALLETAVSKVLIGQPLKLVTLKENGNTQTRSSHKVVGIVPVEVDDKGKVKTELTAQESTMVDAVMALSLVGPVRQNPKVTSFTRAEHAPMQVVTIK